MYSLETFQRLPISLDQAWQFFSSPSNLNSITPPELGFEILTGFRPGDSMYAGMVIRYRISLFGFIPMHWVTEITHVRDSAYFVDEQRFGPYAFWHHQHFFRAVEGGVEMRDLVHYKLPLGPLGRLAHILFVKKQLQSIFNFRFKELEKKFGTMR